MDIFYILIINKICLIDTGKKAIIRFIYLYFQLDKFQLKTYTFLYLLFVSMIKEYLNITKNILIINFPARRW